MKQYKTIGAVFGVAVCMLLLTIAIAAEPTQGRYENNASWHDVYAPGVQSVGSNYLTEEGQTVLLQPWEVTAGANRTQEILIFTNQGTVDGQIHCSTTSPYITASVDTADIQITPGGYISTLTLTTTDTVAQIQEQTRAAVTVTLTAQQPQTALSATFLVTLYPETVTQEQTIESTEITPQTNLSVQQSQEALAFAWEEKLVFSLTAEENADTLELMYNGDHFPEKTRYSIAQGESFVLADPMAIEIPVEEISALQICLDFSQTDVVPLQTVNITATAYRNEIMTGQISFAAPVTRNPMTIEAGDIKPVITGNETLVIPMLGDDTGLTWKLEYLTQTDAGIAYIEAEDLFSLTVQIRPKQDDNETVGQELILSNETGKAPAGTYRLTLCRLYEDVVISTCYFNFFVHY